MHSWKWLIWIGGMFVATEIAKHVGPWVMIVAVTGLVWWSIEQENNHAKS